MSPVVSEEPEFVVVGRLQSLVAQQDNMRTSVTGLRSRLGCLEIRMSSMERESEMNVHMRRVVLSFAAAVTPIIVSIIMDQNIPTHPGPLIDLLQAFSKLMLAFAACVGIPLLVQSLGDFHQAASTPLPKLLHYSPLEDDSGNSASERETETEEEEQRGAGDAELSDDDAEE